ncbi:MAG: hypothetical protein R8P61_24735 [Bacteroidia bacterium]|nr:hypothetical protein [Bacteroidia bacterium]
MNKGILIQLIFCLLFLPLLPAQSEEEFEHPEWEFQEITQKQYEAFQKIYFSQIRQIHPFKELGLILDHSCDEICESFLKDETEKDSMYLPSNYDAGIIGIAHAVSGNSFLIYSAYDGPDYEEYYDFRSEVIAYKISSEKGLAAIIPWFSWTTRDWSIEELIWIDDTQIALKIYEEGRWGDGSELDFKYLKTQIN